MTQESSNIVFYLTVMKLYIHTIHLYSMISIPTIITHRLLQNCVDSILIHIQLQHKLFESIL